MPESPPNPVVFLPLNEFSVERVFPIRSIVGDGSTAPNQNDGGVSRSSLGSLKIQKGTNTTGSTLDTPPSGDSESEPNYLPPPYPLIPPATAIRRLSLPPQPEVSEDDDADGEQLRRISERIQLVPTLSGPPGVLPTEKNEKGEAEFFRCEDEPIHTPGAIQQFGALIALRYDEEGLLKVRIASENTAKLLKYTPEQLFELDSFLDVLEESVREDVETRIAHALDLADDSSEVSHLDVFTMSITAPSGVQAPLWCAIHISEGTNNLVICEFEKLSDIFYLDGLQDKKLLPREPVNTIDNEVAPAERLKSVTSGSVPLRVLQIARHRQRKGVSSMDIFNAMTQAQYQLASSTSVPAVLDTVVGLISELTGFHRVMFYRFDSKKNGVVEAELVDPLASRDIFRGLHFPATDIPAQARELYKINRIRILYDRDEETARLVCRDISDFENKLDLTHSYLRAMSPIHLKYLTNMGVRSSMSVSIVIDSDLWGLIACHGYGDSGLRVTLPIRELCRNIGECAATNIQRLIMLQRVQARKPPPVSAPQKNPSGFIAASSTDLLLLFGADFGLLSIQDEARAIGRLEPYREALALLSHLQARRFTTVMASQNVNEDFPDLKYTPGIKAIAGLLVIPLSMGGNDFLVFFRKGQLNEVRWAGNPYEKITRAGSQYLEPRGSFKRWTEIIIGMSKDWGEDELDTAHVLSLLYGRFIEIWRQKEAASQNNRMTRLLIRNSAHEVRTPLNQIVNYLEMALENKVDEATREILAKAQKSSRSLIYVIDDLLNLTKAEDGHVTSVKETFDLGVTVSEVITAFRKEAIRKGLDLTVSTHQGIPEMVKGDPSRLRQVLSNVTSNAFQHSVEGGIRVDIRPIRIEDTSSVIGITVQDVGIGMSEAQLDDLFQQFEQIMDEDTPSSETPPTSDDSHSIGVGLAVVARYVRNMNGQIRVRSELGKGTIFGIELPFEHASGTPGTSHEEKHIREPPPPRPLSATGLQIRAPYEAEDSDNSTVYASPLSKINTRGSSESSELVFEEQTPFSTSQHPSGSATVTTPSFSDTDNPTSSVESSGPAETSRSTFPFPEMDSPTHSTRMRQELLNVLIAEDNPINAKLLTKRLTKSGHAVEVSYDGQECHDYFASKPHDVDVILMDLQMPLVDGDLSTRMIRHYEQEIDSRTARSRVPIIAVSASLTEDKRYDYVQSGFDGWILKPIDFSRLELLLQSIKRPELRKDTVYAPGQWERGGWFLP